MENLFVFFLRGRREEKQNQSWLSREVGGESRKSCVQGKSVVEIHGQKIFVKIFIKKS